MIILLITAFLMLIKPGCLLPVVDPGLFVISGVQTCGNGSGYCLLGADCRLNQDFLPDPTGHCTGLKGAFTPVAHFVCCTTPDEGNELREPYRKRPGKPTIKPVLKPEVATTPQKLQQPLTTSTEKLPISSSTEKQKEPLTPSTEKPQHPQPSEKPGSTPETPRIPLLPSEKPNSALLPSSESPQSTMLPSTENLLPSSEKPYSPLLPSSEKPYSPLLPSSEKYSPLLPSSPDESDWKPSIGAFPIITTLPPIDITTSFPPENPMEADQIQVSSNQSNETNQYFNTVQHPAKPEEQVSGLVQKTEQPDSLLQLNNEILQSLTTLKPMTSVGVTTEQPESETFATPRQTITSPPDYIQVDQEEGPENSVDWEAPRNTSTTVVDSSPCKRCNPQTAFLLGQDHLCTGSYLRHGWVLTSASCALRVFRAGMIRVTARYINDPEVELLVKTIAVHEDYRPFTSNVLHPEANNIGLILLNSEPNKTCSPCIPDKEDKFTGNLCSTTANSTALSIKINKKDQPTNDDVCEGVLETMQGEGPEEFFTVACDHGSESRYSMEDRDDSGKGLMCRGYVAGIETSSGPGTSVFTKVSHFSDWITTNMMQEQRQDFDTGFTF